MAAAAQRARRRCSAPARAAVAAVGTGAAAARRQPSCGLRRLARPAPLPATAPGGVGIGLVLAPAGREPQRRSADPGPAAAAGHRPVALWRDPAQRVLRQPLHRSRSPGPRAPWLGAGRAPEPLGRGPQPLGHGRIAAPRHWLRHRWPAGAGPGAAHWRAGTRHRPKPPKSATAARARAAGDPGRSPDADRRRARRPRFLWPGASRPPASHAGRGSGMGRRHAGAARGQCAGPDTGGRTRAGPGADPVRQRAVAGCGRSGRGRPRRAVRPPATAPGARRHHAAVLLLRRAGPCGVACQGTSGAAPARPPAAHRHRSGARRERADLDHLDGGWISLDGHAGPRQHQPIPLDGAQLARAVSLARPAPVRADRRRLAAARRAFGLRDGARRLPLDLPVRHGPDRGAQPRLRRAARAGSAAARARRRAAAAAGHAPHRAGRRRWQCGGATAAADRRRGCVHWNTAGQCAGRALSRRRFSDRAGTRHGV